MATKYAPVTLDIPPGVVKTETDRVAEGRYIDSDKMRFVGGLPQKIGGNEVLTDTATLGIPRSLHAFRNNDFIRYVGVGTYKKLYVYDSAWTQFDITPLDGSGTLTDPFTTTNLSTEVVVTDVSHGRTVGSTVIFDGATAVGGITIDGPYTVGLIVDVDNYTITHSVAATSSAGPGGGTVSYEYEITIGTEYGAIGLGYGVHFYGLGTYGTPRDTSTVVIEPRIWALDNFGQVLLGSPNTAGLYFWDSSTGSATETRAAIVADAPVDIRYMFITPERIVVALCDDMRIDWSDQGDYTNWTPALDNTARSGRRVAIGTKLIAGVVLQDRVSLIWTDYALFVHEYTGSQALVFDTRIVSKDCGLIAPAAKVVVNGAAYWMGHDNFFMFNGGVQPIPNVEDIREFVFDALNTERAYLCAAAYVPKYNEVWFLYAATGENDPGLYVIVNIDNYSWAVGTFDRVSSTRFQHSDTRPIMGAPDGHLYQHETGNDDDGAAMAAHIEFAPKAIANGRDLMSISGFISDFHEQAGIVTVNLEARNRLRDAATVDTASITVADANDAIDDIRLSGRYIGGTITSNTLGGYFRMGKPIVLVKPQGQRRP